MPARRTEAARRLIAWLGASPERTQERLAKVLGVTQQTVSVWFSGRCRPTQLVRLKIQRATGIDPDLWLTHAERRAINSLVGAGSEANDTQPAQAANG